MFTVYRHISPSGKSYIGITSRDVNERWNHDGSGYKTQPFWNAIKKYGWENFDHEILATNLTEDEAKKAERMYIAMYSSTNSKYGYNVSIGGDGVMTGRKHSEESKQKMSAARKGKMPWSYGKKATPEHRRHLSEAHKGYKPSEETRKKLSIALKGHRVNVEALEKPVTQMDLLGNELNEFKSISAAARALNLSTSHITECCRGRREQSNGFKWKYKFETPEIIQEKAINIETIPRRKKAVVQLTKSGEFVAEFGSVREAQNNTGIGEVNIGQCCMKKRKTAGGYKWVYRKEFD